MKRGQILLMFFWTALSIFVMGLSYKMGLGGFRQPGPGLMPFLLGVFLCLVSLYLLASSFLRAIGEGNTKETTQKRQSVKKVFLVVASLVIYALVLQKLGYLIATALLLFVLFYAAGTKKPVAMVSSVITTLLSYFVFTYLGLIFPPGILRFLGG